MLDKFMLRRTKQILIDNNVLTVNKTIHRETLDFTPFERKLYDQLEKKIVHNVMGHELDLDDQSAGTSSKKQNVDLSYMSILTYLLRLRQLCCHWKLLFNLTQQFEDDSLMNEIKSSMIEPKAEKSISNSELDDALVDDDLRDLLGSMRSMRLDNVKDSQTSKNEDGEEGKYGENAQSLHAIKLQRTLNILKKDQNDKPRKTIIFSEFTSMLDILSEALIKNGIRFVRYDGKMDKNLKDAALKSLNDDPKIHAGKGYANTETFLVCWGLTVGEDKGGDDTAQVTETDDEGCTDGLSRVSGEVERHPADQNRHAGVQAHGG
ncbi:hypothetical protein PMKS-003396 [Pichia membranifaciens]|uniref:Helicase C-terminal domain-containing protein n=1 Tax=Pichia membranifaciens TaxID=4926 RepID=A0A1Q2YK23_9ASCO|nr:hypothetical protein PMKS-003396 [Pichia membranifaciens]